MRKPPHDSPPPKKDRAAAELGRRGGLKGGAVRASRMTPEERTESARMAAAARWARVASTGQDQSSGRNRDGQPFVFELGPVEVAYITDTSVSGKGGLQSLQKELQSQLEHGNVVTLDNAGLGQLIRYMTQYGEGSFETRLRRAFARSFLDLFTPIFEAERRS
jgi:hypothetical protein